MHRESTVMYFEVLRHTVCGHYDLIRRDADWTAASRVRIHVPHSGLPAAAAAQRCCSTSRHPLLFPTIQIGNNGSINDVHSRSVISVIETMSHVHVQNESRAGRRDGPIVPLSEASHADHFPRGSLNIPQY